MPCSSLIFPLHFLRSSWHGSSSSWPSKAGRSGAVVPERYQHVSGSHLIYYSAPITLVLYFINFVPEEGGFIWGGEDNRVFESGTMIERSLVALGG